MITDVRFSADFEKSFKRLKKKYPSIGADFKELLQSLIENPLQGDELTEGIRKVRMAITSKGKGKRGGARVIVRVAIIESQLCILYIYDKSDMESVSDLFIKQVLEGL